MGRIQNIYLAFLDSLGVYLLITMMHPPLISRNPSQFIGGILQIVIISSLLWISGVILNDLFDLEKDKKLFPSRVLVQNLVSIYSAKCLAIVLQVISILVCAVSPYSIKATPILIILIGLIYLYNIIKKIGLLGALTMGLCRTLNCVYAAAIAYGFQKEYINPFVGILIIPVFIYTFFTIFLITKLSLYEGKKIRLLYLMSILILLMIPLTISATLTDILIVIPATIGFGHGGNAHFLSLLMILKTIFTHFLLNILPYTLFLIPTFIYKQIDTLGLLHLYVSGLYLLGLSTFLIRPYNWFLVGILLLAYYIRKFFLKGVFIES